MTASWLMGSMNRISQVRFAPSPRRKRRRKSTRSICSGKSMKRNIRVRRACVHLHTPTPALGMTSQQLPHLARGGSGGSRGVSVCSASRSEAQSEFRKALDEQVRAKKLCQVAAKERERQYEDGLFASYCQQQAVRKAAQEAARVQERDLLTSSWQEEVRIRDIKKAIECIEQGKCPPCEKRCGLAATLGMAPSARSSMTPRPSAKVCNSLETPRQFTPRDSARGMPLGAAASLSLQHTPVQVV